MAKPLIGHHGDALGVLQKFLRNAVVRAAMMSCRILPA